MQTYPETAFCFSKFKMLCHDRNILKYIGIQCVLGTLKSICSYWPCLEENMAEMEEIEESKRMSVAEKLSQGLETLSLHDQAVSGDGRQQHGE